MIVSSRADTKTLLRDHEVEHDPESGLLSLLGGKWTTYRLMAQDAIDRAGELLKKSVPGITETHYLVGGENYRFDAWQALKTQYGFSDDVCKHLVQTYGVRAEQVAQITQEQPALAEKLIDESAFSESGGSVSGTGRNGRDPAGCAGPPLAAGTGRLAANRPGYPTGCRVDGIRIGLE